MDAAVHHVDAKVAASSPGLTTTVEGDSHADGKASPPEFALVCLCARMQRSPEERQQVRQLVQQGVAWQKLVLIAEVHGIRPFVFHGLEAAAHDLLPENVRQGIQQYRRTIQIHNTFLVKELGRLQEELATHDVPALSVKGPLLAKVAYGDIHLRRYTDLDVLIPHRCFPAVEELLLAGEYQPFPKVQNLSGLRKRFYLYLSGQWPFMRGRGTFNLDLHTRVMPPGYTFPHAFEPFWDRSRHVSLTEDVTVRGFAPEDMLLMLCFHGVKNQWALLKYACDITELLRATPELDWAAVRSRAQAMRGEKVLAIGLKIAGRLLNPPLPDEVEAWLEQDPVTEETASFMIDVLRKRHAGRELDYTERVRFQLSVKDTWASRARYGMYSVTQHLWSDVLKP